MPPLELYLVTFNCARTLVDASSFGSSLFAALLNRQLPDILAINLQEVAPIGYAFLGGSYIANYLERIRLGVDVATTSYAATGSTSEDGYQLFAARTVGLTALMLFMKPHVAARVAWAQTAGAGVGLWQMGNKGAVGIRVGLDGQDRDTAETELTFVSAHLAPYEGGVARRNQDWADIVRNLVFMDDLALTSGNGLRLQRNLSSTTPPQPREEEEPLLSTDKREPTGLFKPGGHVFFSGDLNYRTSNASPGVTTYHSYPQCDAETDSPLHFKQWLKDDQLTAEREAERTLHGLYEAPIDFPPTYKYVHTTGSHDMTGALNANGVVPHERWNWAPHRYPSWCDRILFAPSKGVETHKYAALPIQATSDHRPVALSVAVHPGALQSPDADEVWPKPPFSINSNWRSERDAARQREVVVGILAYFSLTREGNAIVLGAAAGAVSLWLIVRSLLN